MCGGREDLVTELGRKLLHKGKGFGGREKGLILPRQDGRDRGRRHEQHRDVRLTIILSSINGESVWWWIYWW